MAAKTKPTKRTRRKTAPSKAKPAEAPADPRLKGAPVPVARTANDVREDSAPVVGHFVEVVSGPYKGRYGVFLELGQDGKTATVRTRDSASERLTTSVSDLRPAKAGLR